MSNDSWISSASQQPRPAVQDRKVARINAAAEQRRQDRAAQVEIRAREAELALERRRAELTLRQEKKDARRAAKAKRRESYRRAWSTLATKIHQAIPTIGRRIMIAGPILSPMTVAWIGQIGFALDKLNWWLIGAVLFAAGWELSTAFCGWMYHQARADGDRGTIFRFATWFCAGSAGAMNYWHALDGHAVADPTPKAVSFGAMSLAGIGLWELYALLIHRRALRLDGKLPAARPSFGVVRWVQFPRVTWTARKLVILRGYGTVDEAWQAALRELAGRGRAKAERKNAKSGRAPIRVTLVLSNGPTVRRAGPTQWTRPPIVWLPDTTPKATVVDHSLPMVRTTPGPMVRTTPQQVDRTTAGSTPRTTPEPVVRTTSETAARTTSGNTQRSTPRTTGRGGPKGRRRTRDQLRAQLEEKVQEIYEQGGEIQVQPIAKELKANRTTVRELLDEMNVRPMVRKAANQ